MCYFGICSILLSKSCSSPKRFVANVCAEKRVKNGKRSLRTMFVQSANPNTAMSYISRSIPTRKVISTSSLRGSRGGENAIKGLNGRFFGGRTISAQPVVDAVYSSLFSRTKAL